MRQERARASTVAGLGHGPARFLLAAASGAFVLGLLPAASAAENIFAVTEANVLVSFDSATPGTVTFLGAITGLQVDENVLAIDFRPATGQLYAVGSTSRLYTINTTTAVVTQVGTAGAFTLSGTQFGFDFNPVADRIRVVSNLNQNLRLNPNDGTLTSTDTNLGFAAGDANFGQDPVVVGSAYTNNVAGALTTTLYGIHVASNNAAILVTQNPPNDGTLNTVGALGVNSLNFVSFDVSGASAVAYAALTPAPGPSSLYTINLATGSATLVGSIGAPTIKAIAVGGQGGGVPPTPTPTATQTPTPTRTATPTVTVPGGGGAAPSDIPTLSGWAMGALVLLLGTLGYLLLRSSSSAG